MIAKYKLGPYFLLFLQIIAHIGLIYGLFNFTLYEWILVFLIYFITGCLGVSITFHRLLSHGAFKTFKFLEYVGTIFATYGMIGSSLAWVNNHRAHHYKADLPGDPHSPLIFGFIQVQWFSMFYSKTYFRFVKKLIKDKFHVFLHKNYFLIHFSLLILFLIIFGWQITALIYLAPAAILWNAGSLINTIGHYKKLGYINYKIKDESTNNIFLGYLVWGEGWHNNHHKFPAKANFKEKWWEFDLSYQVIKLLNKLN